MKSIVWLVCFYALLIGSTLALPNSVEARNKKHSKAHPKAHPKKHPHPHPHPTHPHPSHPTATPSTVTVGAVATSTSTVTTTTTVSTRSTVAAGAGFTPIRSQLTTHVPTRRDIEANKQHAKRDTTVTVTTSTTTVTTTTTATATAVATDAPFYAQCVADNFVTAIDGNYIDYIAGTNTVQTVQDTDTADDCCIACQKTSGCIAFLYRAPLVPMTKRSIPSVLHSCTLLSQGDTKTCTAPYDAHQVLPEEALNVGKTTIGNGACGSVNVVPLL